MNLVASPAQRLRAIAALVLLGARLARRAPGGALARALIVLTASLAAFTVLAISSVPGVMTAQQHRMEAQRIDDRRVAVGEGIRVTGTTVSTPSGELNIVALAEGYRSPPPGLPLGLPASAVAASPAARGLVQPYLEQDAGNITIADPGLVTPDQLLIYRIVPRAQLDDALELAGFGLESEVGSSSHGSRYAAVAGVLLGIPLLLLWATSIRYRSSSSRAQSSALTAVGCSSGQARLATLVDPLAASATGAGLGAIGFVAASRSLDRLPGLPASWFPSDVELSSGRITVVLLSSVIVAATLATVAPSTRSSAARGQGRLIPPPRWWTTVPLTVGTGILVAVGLRQLGTENEIAGSQPWFAVIAGGGLLCILGLPLAVPYISYVLSRAVDRLPAVGSSLGVARLRHEPRASTRMAGIAGAVTMVMLATAPTIAAVTSPPARFVAQLSDAGGRTLIVVRSIADESMGVLSAGLPKSVREAAVLSPAQVDGFDSVASMTCSQFTVISGSQDCSPGLFAVSGPKEVRLEGVEQPVSRIRSPAASARSGLFSVLLDVRRERRTAAMTRGADGLILVADQPVRTEQDVADLSTSLALLAPAAQVEVIGSEAFVAGAGMRDLQRWLVAAMIVLAVLSGVACSVGLAASWRDGLASRAGLVAMGARTRTLRAALFTQLVVGLSVASAVGVAGGFGIAVALGAVSGIDMIEVSLAIALVGITATVGLVLAVVPALLAPVHPDIGQLRRVG